MLKKNSAKSQPSRRCKQARAAEDLTAIARRPVETASTGSGTVIDPSATDTKPPGVYDLDLLA